MSSSDRLAAALAALDEVLMQPTASRVAAEGIVAENGDDEAASVAWRAIGRAWKETGNLDQANRALRRAIDIADELGLPVRAAEARMSLVVILADQGQTDAAIAEAELAAAVLTGVDRARLGVNWGLVLQRTGRIKEALKLYAESLPVLRAAEDTGWEALLLNLRGTLYVYLGQGRDAEADLVRAEEITRGGGYRLLNAMIHHNLGFAASRAGDLPTALNRLDAAAKIFAEHEKSTAPILQDRAEALMTVGLSGEARAAVLAAIAEQNGSGFRYDLAESHLMLARAALADGDPAAAMEAAEIAQQAFAGQQRTAWADLARHIEASARFAQEDRSASLLQELTADAERLEAGNWSIAPHAARLMAGQIAVDLGRGDLARDLFDQVARARSNGSADLRTLAWHARALYALSEDRPVAAEQALRAGLRIHAENNAVLGATDLRAHASVNGEAMATLGLRLALDRKNAKAVLRWAETWRAASLRRRPVRPPDDEQLADDLASLRRAVAQIAEAETATRSAARTETGRLHAERLRLEQSIRDRSRYAHGTYAPERQFSPKALAEALGERTLVEFIRLDDQLHAITVAAGAVRRHRLGSYKDVLRALDMVRFTMNRMSRRFGSQLVQDAAVAAYESRRTILDDLLFGPLRRVVGAGGDRELVVVPTGSLHALPWTVLPTCADRPVSVTPSARLWQASAEAPGDYPPKGSTILMAGPGLAHAEPEVDALAARYPDARVFTGDGATATAVLDALDGAALAHIATHGHFRTDHPLFSNLDMADGPLYVYDLERLTSTPDLLILSACESALSGVRPGDELMGLASAVFALGTRTLIASVTPVNDADTCTLMLALHAGLADGQPPAVALAKASTDTGISGFVCFGFGG